MEENLYGQQHPQNAQMPPHIGRLASPSDQLHINPAVSAQHDAIRKPSKSCGN
jgi:chitin synthase